MDFPKRGEIWYVNLDPTLGAEIKKTRPALIISNDVNNEYAATITVLPITDKGEKVYPFEVALNPHKTGLNKESKVKCQQIRTVDKVRLIKKVGQVDEDIVQAIQSALRIHLGITED